MLTTQCCLVYNCVTILDDVVQYTYCLDNDVRPRHRWRYRAFFFFRTPHHT